MLFYDKNDEHPILICLECLFFSNFVRKMTNKQKIDEKNSIISHGFCACGHPSRTGRIYTKT
jgi:hypothetical protein